jgi:hypothetical protein
MPHAPSSCRYSTFCGLASVDPADDHEGVFPIDSVDLWPLLSGRNGSAPRDVIVLGHEFQMNSKSPTNGALIVGDFKLIIGPQTYSDYRGPMYPCVKATPAPGCSPNCFFNLRLDPHEHHDLANDSSAADHYQRLLTLYYNQTNLFYNTTTDEAGFNDAIHNKYRGYMGPWLPSALT